MQAVDHPSAVAKRPAGVWSALALVLLFFFISGACGLLYQVVWTRKLVLLFGTTSYAVSTVLSIFFLGLGFGSVWGGRLADRSARPLRVYAVFEILIGLWAVLFIVCVSYGEHVVVALLRAFDWSRGTGVGLRALLALALLFVPVCLMGATLPLLAKFVTRGARVRGLPIGALFTLNTLGAVTGCFTTGFFLLEDWGYTRTTLLGAAANIAVGIVAWIYSRNEKGDPREENAPQDPLTETAFAERRWVAWMVIAAFALQGFCALALEVLWTRLLIIVFLGTTYAYTTMLTTLLCGIAAGSLAGALLVDRLKRPAVVLGGSMAVTGIFCIALLAAIAGFPEKVTELHRSTGNDWTLVSRGLFLLSFFALFPPTFCFGLAFPLVVKSVSSLRATLGRDVGRLYSANTLGGVFGAVAGGFLLIPLLGTHQGIILLSLLLFFGGMLLLFAPPAGLARSAAGTLLVVLLMAAWWRAPQDVSQALNASYVPEDHRVISYREGTEGTVAVSEPIDETEATNRVLWINRVQATASIEKGVKMNRLQGVLPLLFDRDPKRVLFMCFGSGITCGTLAMAGFEHIDAVEISPDVLAAAPLFEKDNRGVLQRPNVRFHIDDGRNYLLTSPETYDLITFEPMPLALAGVSTFYTRDYYELCLERLAPGGLVSQWVPMHSLSPEVVKSLVHTFTTVFPEFTAWFINADLFLIGSNQPLRIDPVRAQEKLARPELAEALAAASFPDALEVMASFLMDKEAVLAYSAGGTVMTDDRPWAEFVAPKLVYERLVQNTVGEVIPHTTPVGKLLAPGTPPELQAALELRHRARLHDLEGVRRYYGGIAIGDESLEPFYASLEIDPKDENAKFYLRQMIENQAENYLRWEEYADLEKLLRQALEHMPGEAEFHLYLGDALHGKGDATGAAAAYAEYLRLGGHEARASERAALK